MADELKQYNDEFGAKRGLIYRYRKVISGLMVGLIVIGLGAYLYITDRIGNTDGDIPAEEKMAEVVVKPFGELVREVTIEKVATIEPAVGAPLVARTGGRVSEVQVELGGAVEAGRVVVSIDAGVEPNVAVAQLTAVTASLGQINRIESEALRAADNGIKMAQLAVEAAKAGKGLTAAQWAKNEEQADLAARQAELSYDDAVEAEQRIDQVVRAADIGLKAAKLAQDQADIAQKIGGRQASDGLKQAEQGLSAAKQATDKIKAEMQAQRVSLQGQAAAAAEQVKMAQVISPVDGQVTRLTVRYGDFVRPGQEVGEVIALAGAQIRLNVATGVRDSLRVGDRVDIRARGQKFTGIVARLADAPRTDMALWQVDIYVSGTPQVVHPGALVVVDLPVGVSGLSSNFIPLDVVVVRQGGVVLMTVEDNGVVQEHPVTPISYTGDYVEGRVEIWDSAAVIVTGHRTVRAGDRVKIRS